MLGIPEVICALGVPALVLGAAAFASWRARDQKRADREERLIALLERQQAPAAAMVWGGAEVVVGKRSGRTTPPEGVAVREAAPSRSIEQIAAELCPDGPRPARELARALGYECVPVELGGRRGIAWGGVVHYQPGGGEERSILDALAGPVLREAGYPVSERNLSALVAALSRPVPVAECP